MCQNRRCDTVQCCFLHRSPWWCCEHVRANTKTREPSKENQYRTDSDILWRGINGNSVWLGPPWMWLLRQKMEEGAWPVGVACNWSGWSKYFTLKCKLLNAELHLFEMSNLQKTAKHAGIHPFSGQTLANPPTHPSSSATIRLLPCLDAFVMNRMQLLWGFFPSSITWPSRRMKPAEFANLLGRLRCQKGYSSWMLNPIFMCRS